MFWAYVILLLPVVVAVALIPTCWLRERLLQRRGEPQWLEPQWLPRANRHVLECEHPVLLESLTGCLNSHPTNSSSRS